ncbi:MAG: alpha/beta hydrolase [Pirellulales bacterium]|nr:alpha/beta hydrolase [Pirellulales bacterium]
METVTVRDFTMAIQRQGQGTPALVLVHGFPLDHTMWKYQLAEFSQRHLVVAPDLHGFGKSSRTGGKLTMEHMADDLEAMLGAAGLEGKIVLIALSMGGYVALEFARKYADRLQGLVLCDTRAGADPPEAAEGRIAMAERVEKEGVLPVVEAMFPKLIEQSWKKDNPTDAELLWHMMMSAHPETVAAALRGMAERTDHKQTLAEINVPALVIVGEHDAITPPAESQSMAKSLPQATLVEIAGAGHMAPLEKPVEVNNALQEFLTQLS